MIDQPRRFEWDERKAARNATTHGIDFLRASRIFKGPIYTQYSPRGGEDRWMTVGLLDDRLSRLCGLGVAKSSGSSRRGRHEMSKSERVVRYTEDEIEDRIARGEDRTDWTRVDALTAAELEAAIASDPDAEPGPMDLARARSDVPGPKENLHVQVDSGVLEWFKAQNGDHRARINAVLRAYVEHQRERGSA